MHDRSYYLGRLFSALETVRERAGAGLFPSGYYVVAGNNPATMFPRLLTENLHYSKRLRRQRPDLHERLKAIVQGIVSRLPADPFPADHDNQQQWSFWLGRVHEADEECKSGLRYSE